MLFSHCFVLTGHAEDEPVAMLLLHRLDGGALAVAGFFALSGFLIARSAERRGRWAYFRARALRIYPAFLVCVALQTLVLGLAYSRLPVGGYFADPLVWGALARSLVFSVPAGLPGVFDGNPVPGVVNGSLWTLRVEAACYVGLLGLAELGLLRRGWVLVPLAVAWVVAGACLWWPAGIAVRAVVGCALHFMMGAALWAYADAIPRRGWMAGAGVVLVVAAFGAGPGWAMVGEHLVLPYLVLWAGLAARSESGRLPDVSYGVYLYAFPVQQAVVAQWGAGLGAGLGAYGLMAVTAGPVLGLGVLSWWLVERRALGARGL